MVVPCAARVETALGSPNGSVCAVTTLDPQIQAALAWSDAQPGLTLGTDPIAAIRESYDASASVVDADPPTMTSITDLGIPASHGSIPARLFTPEGSLSTGLVIWLHGGGWFQGSLVSHDPTFRRVAATSTTRLLAVDYRLAPENPFPCGLDDVATALDWVFANTEDLEVDRSKVVIGGDSAGANLALVTALGVAGTDRSPALQVLCYPPLGPTLLTDSLHELGEGYGLTAAEMTFCWETYLGPWPDHADPRVSPLLSGDIGAAPPAIVSVGGFDPLRDEVLAYVGLLEGAGVETTLLMEETLIHGFMRLSGISDAARNAVARVGHSIAATIGDGGDPR